MDALIVSARKYRPSLFREVRSQPQVVTTLRNQIKSQKIPQVVLFCGPRGSGKTSCARIFAKAINCEALTMEGEPCNQCLRCRQFQANTSMNIHELDAASNNSVDDARQLLEQVRFHASSGKRVFIIDEVHMLSNAAFNALLKTLEEPPPHVIFILATTEKHKIIPTILSRCQIFDFYPIEAKEIFTQLRYIAEKERIQADEEALHLISAHSEGSFREALHTFDRILAFGGGKLTQKDVLGNLQIIDPNHYFALTEALYQGHIGAALQSYDAMLRLGFESLHFIQGFGKHVRNLIVAQTTASSSLLDTSPKVTEAYCRASQKVEAHFLYEVLSMLAACELHYRARQDKRLHVEVTLIQIARLRTSSPYASKASKGSEPKPEAVQAPKASVHPPTMVPPQDALLDSKSPSEAKRPPMEATSAPTSAMTSLPPSPPPIEGPINLASVKSHWSAYQERLKEKGVLSAYATMDAPLLVEGGNLVLQISNALQKNALQPYQDDLLTFLRHELALPSLNLTFRLIPLAAQAPKPHTPQEKLRDLVGRYPAVGELEKGLGLSP